MNLNLSTNTEKRKFFDFKHGCTRWVFLIGNFAVKIPKLYPINRIFLNLCAMLVEVKYFLFSNDKAICPIIFAIPPLVIIMPRCKKAPNENSGYYKGQLVALDYGGHPNPIHSILCRLRLLPQRLKELANYKSYQDGSIRLDKYVLKFGNSKEARKRNIHTFRINQELNSGNILPIIYSAPFGLLNITPDYNPFPEGNLISSGQFIFRLEPQLRVKIKQPYNPRDFGFLNGRFVVVNYSSFK